MFFLSFFFFFLKAIVSHWRVLNREVLIGNCWSWAFRRWIWQRCEQDRQMMIGQWGRRGSRESGLSWKPVRREEDLTEEEEGERGAGELGAGRPPPIVTDSAGAGRDQMALGNSGQSTSDLWENGVDLQGGAEPRSKQGVRGRVRGSGRCPAS